MVQMKNVYNILARKNLQNMIFQKKLHMYMHVYKSCMDRCWERLRAGEEEGDRG